MKGVKSMETYIDYAEEARLLKALAHPIRLQIVHGLLTEGCHNVRCIENRTGVSQSCTSQHLQRLRSAGIVEAERVGNEVYYRVSSQRMARLMAALTGEEAAVYVL